MATLAINGAGRPLKDIFSDRFAFTIPYFQRPYAWTIVHTGELINDLLKFVQEEAATTDFITYFLGSIILIKEEYDAQSEVVDGQQRLTTLTILLAVLRTLVPSEDHKESLRAFLYEKGNKISGTSNRYRLRLREKDAYFFQRYIQEMDTIEQLEALDPDQLTSSQQHIRENALLIHERLKNLNEDQCVNLAQVIINRCFLVEISTPDLNSAYRVFSVLNSRGLNLSHSDILKADILGKVARSRQDRYTQKWETYEIAVGESAFNLVFELINAIYSERIPSYRNETLKVFQDSVYPAKLNIKQNKPEKFLDDTLFKYLDIFQKIRHKEYKHSKDAEEINDLFRWLSFFDDFIWMPLVMAYCYYNAHDSQGLIRFLKDLERLLFISEAAGIARRVIRVRKNLLTRFDSDSEAYKSIMQIIKNRGDLYESNCPLQISTELKELTLQALSRPLLYGSEMPLIYTFLRIDNNIAAPDQVRYLYRQVTIEHVLPQTPKENSKWLEWFPDPAQRKDYVNCLGNLVLLSRSKNSEASNLEFDEKKRKYFTSPKGVATYALTMGVVHEKEWTPEVIDKRQKDLLDLCKKVWRLG